MNGGGNKERSPTSTIPSPLAMELIPDQSPSISRVASPRPPLFEVSKDSTTVKPPTKLQNLKRVWEDISEMLIEFKTMQNEKHLLAAHKHVAINLKDKLNDVKVKESDAKWEESAIR